jgi:diaminopimelate epimerase
MDFVKMEGLGNDFVVVDGPFEPSPEQVASWCDRRRGIGADGVLVVTPVDDGTVRMGYWNADGSAAEMCGNGLRCVARRAVDVGLVTVTEFTVETPVGPRHAVVGKASVRVELGPVSASGATLEVAGHEVETASVGNPHAVVVVDDPTMVPVEVAGPSIETAPEFPDRTNVGFASVRSDESLILRVWERGVGETLACGTGAAAAVAVAHRRGLTSNRVEVTLPGGVLLVEIVDGTAWIEGPAVTVFAGRI